MIETTDHGHRNTRGLTELPCRHCGRPVVTVCAVEPCERRRQGAARVRRAVAASSLRARLTERVREEVPARYVERTVSDLMEVATGEREPTVWERDTFALVGVPLPDDERQAPDTTDTFATETEAVAYLARDGGRVPCSRYGWNGRSCAPVAYAAALILTRETEGGDPTAETLDYVMGLVVNDHDDLASLIVEHGPSNRIDPADYLEPDVIAEAQGETTETECIDDGDHDGPESFYGAAFVCRTHAIARRIY